MYDYRCPSVERAPMFRVRVICFLKMLKTCATVNHPYGHRRTDQRTSMPRTSFFCCICRYERRTSATSATVTRQTSHVARRCQSKFRITQHCGGVRSQVGWFSSSIGHCYIHVDKLRVCRFGKGDMLTGASLHDNLCLDQGHLALRRLWWRFC